MSDSLEQTLTHASTVFRGIPGYLVRNPESLVVLVLIVLILVALVIRAQRLRPATGSESLVGRLATVMAPLEPTGKVFLESTIWEATCGEYVPKGAMVRVTKVDGLRLTVEKAETPDHART